MIAIKPPINFSGELLSLNHYPNSSSPTYDATTEVPNNGTVAGSTLLGIVKDPSIREIQFSGGLLTENSKKFILDPTITIDNGDTITHKTIPYTITFIQKFNTRIVCYGVKI